MKNILINKKNAYFDRKIEKIECDFFQLSQTIRIENEFEATIVTAQNWICTKIENQGTQFIFTVNGVDLKIPYSEFYLYIPSFSIIQFKMTSGISLSFGISSCKSTNFDRPMVLKSINFEFIKSYGFLKQAISLKDSICVNRTPQPSIHGLKTKAFIDKNFKNPLKFLSISKQLGISQDILSRSFKNDYGITPNQYKTKLRIVTAIESLLRGRKIVDTCFNVGFQDLSRFNKQFKKNSSVSPKKYSI